MKITVMMTVDDIVTPEVRDHAEADGIALDLKLHRDARHLDPSHPLPGWQRSRRVQGGGEDRRLDAAFFQAFGYLPRLVDVSASMGMKRFNCA